MSRNAIRIEAGVAMPEAWASKGTSKYPFKDMKVGDSFLVPEGTSRGAIQSAAYYAGNTLSAKFVVRVTPEGLRCWRVV